MPLVRSAVGLVLAGLVVMGAKDEARARTIVSTHFDAANVDLGGVVDLVHTTDKQISVEIPASQRLDKYSVDVSASRDGAVHHWAIFTLHNPDSGSHDFVLGAKRKGFVGSGVLWPRHVARQILTLREEPKPTRLDLHEITMDAFALRIGPGETRTYVLELAGPDISGLSLWRRSAYDAQSRRGSFFHGVVLGISLLIAVFIIGLVTIRAEAAFLAAALLAVGAIGFIWASFAHFIQLTGFADAALETQGRWEAIAEGLLTAGALACLYSFANPARRMRRAGQATIGLFAAALLLSAYGWFNPAVASGIARLLMVATTMGGSVVILILHRRGVLRAQATLAFWGLLTVWALCAMTAAAGWGSDPVMIPLLDCGLVLVLVAMALTLIRLAFDREVINSRFFEDNNRCALALAATRQSVWDWNESRGRLRVGGGLERVLGLKPGTMARDGHKLWLDLIHPADRATYASSVEKAVRRARGAFSCDFRLRDADGDYLWHHLRAYVLPDGEKRAVRCIGILSEITQARRVHEQILFDAVHDCVSDLPNHVLFADRLQCAIKGACADGNSVVTVLVVDLDRFKGVNERLGCAAGDTILLMLARRLRAHLDPCDTLTRLRGDRFGVITNPQRTGRPIETCLDEIRRIIAQPIALRSGDISLTASIGAATLHTRTHSAQELLEEAGLALCEAKKSGKGIAVFKPDIHKPAKGRGTVKPNLHQALEDEKIDLVYQPVMRLSDMKIAGFDARPCWPRDGHAPLASRPLIELAEETGSVVELSLYTLTQAARQLGIWQRAYRPDSPLFITVGLLSQEVVNRDLVDEVKAVLEREELMTGSLKLSISESVFMRNPELTLCIVERLRALDIGIVCDDFGAGRSALVTLSRLPFDAVRVAHPLLAPNVGEKAPEAIFDAVIMLAHKLDMKIMARDVENAWQLTQLDRMRCDFAQGNHLYRPLSASQVVDMLGSGRFVSAETSTQKPPARKTAQSANIKPLPSQLKTQADKKSSATNTLRGDSAQAI
ncbi:MAG: EAL domain-containing protein [Hyphomicrobiales bacterium]